MMRGAAILLVLAASAARAGVFTPVASVRFTDLRTISQSVQTLGKMSGNVMLKTAIPMAIRNQDAAKWFGPMRPGFDGVAVGYVDSQAIAYLASAQGRVKKDRIDSIDRAKRWTLLYPGTVSQAGFLKSHPDAKLNGNVVTIPPSRGTPYPHYAIWSADGNWVAVATSPGLAQNTFAAARPALKKPLGGALARVMMDAHGARALFGSMDFSCGAGELEVRLGRAGLELDGRLQHVGGREASLLPPNALSFAGVPANASLFGSAATAGDLRSADMFGLLGAHAGKIVRASVKYLPATAGAPQTYYIGPPPVAGNRRAPAPAASALPARARLERILPEARKRTGLDGVMFCSPVAVFRACLPNLSRTLSPMDEMKVRVAANMLRTPNGQGLGFMSWREGNVDRYFCRISNDEICATSALWGMLFMD